MRQKRRPKAIRDASLAARADAPGRHGRRAQCILLLRQGKTYKEIQRSLRCSPSFIARWKKRVKRQGERGLRALHRGRRTTLTSVMERQIREMLKARWEDGTAILTLGDIAEAVGVDRKTVDRFLAREGFEGGAIHYGTTASGDIQAARFCYLDVVGMFLSRRQRIIAFASRGARDGTVLERFFRDDIERLRRERDPEPTRYAGMEELLGGTTFVWQDIRRERLYGAMATFLRTVDQRYPQLALVIADHNSRVRRRRVRWAIGDQVRTPVNFVPDPEDDQSWQAWVLEVLSWIEEDMRSLGRHPRAGRIAPWFVSQLDAMRAPPGRAAVWIHRDARRSRRRGRKLWLVSGVRQRLVDS